MQTIYPLARRPGRLNVVGLHVRFEILLDRAGNLPQGELAQGVEVPPTEESIQRLLGAACRIDVALLHSLAQRIR